MTEAYEQQLFRYRDFHIHGDNNVECERTLDLILQALNHRNTSLSAPFGSPVCPAYHITVAGLTDPIKLTFYPGFERWDKSVLDAVRERGGILREAADVIITGVASGQEEPLIAIEFCGALPAGNQAWQRSGRAYSFGKSKIPYLYVAELGGYELDKNRSRKAARMPNPAVPFSYLTYSMDQDTPVLPIFTASPGADEDSRRIYADEFADRELVDMVRSILFVEENGEILERLQLKVLSLVKKRAQAARVGRTLSAEQWEEAYSAVKSGESIVDYLARETALPWSKTAYIAALTDSARALMEMSKEFAIGLTSKDLPMCVIKEDVRTDYAARIMELYGDLPDDFIEWLKRSNNLVVCWVMGFKPRGDDARPDRGLPPLARMLVGEGQDLLTVVYGPAPSATWPMLINDPRTLIKRNGLWESILEMSDAVLIDSSTDTQTHHGFVRNHWGSETPDSNVKPFFVSPRPLRIGENDVDTVLHTLLAKLTDDDVFEGMCNPPGGDWSGVSLLPIDRDIEYRWISLPRVSRGGTKRPDHVFQLFNVIQQPIILCVESKELPRAVEDQIGPQVISYVADLVGSPASIERNSPADNWCHSDRLLDLDDFFMASAVAFISGDPSQISNVQERSEADLLLCFEFEEGGGNCSILLVPTTKIGQIIANYICGLDLSKSHIKVRLST